MPVLLNRLLNASALDHSTKNIIRVLESTTKLYACYEINKLRKKIEKNYQVLLHRKKMKSDREIAEVHLDQKAMALYRVLLTKSNEVLEMVPEEPRQSDIPLELKAFLSAMDRTVYLHSQDSEEKSEKGSLVNAYVMLFVQGAREGGEAGVVTYVSLIPAAVLNYPFASELYRQVFLSASIGIAIPIGLAAAGKTIVTVVGKTKRGRQFLEDADPYVHGAGLMLLRFLTVTLLQYAVHEIEEIAGIENKVYDLTEGDKASIWSEKNILMGLVSAFFPYDANPTFFQAFVIYCGIVWVTIPFLTKGALTVLSKSGNTMDWCKQQIYGDDYDVDESHDGGTGNVAFEEELSADL
ncbi:hypothetical protein CI610_02178 [invertebrate metagenome]|uniref:Uncharacterized protein n=1 Tax=invertebrate metagenome TaxID=1711999 RepID=A0A2H9T6P5_9ZZZZ